MPESQASNEHLLEEDEEILKLSFDPENNEELNNEEVATFDEKKDYELIRVLEDTLLISLFSEVDVKTTFHIQLLVRMNDQHQDKKDPERVFLKILQKDFIRISLDQNYKQISCEICSQEAEDQDERLKDFDVKKIMSIFHRILAAEQQFKIHK